MVVFCCGREQERVKDSKDNGKLLDGVPRILPFAVHNSAVSQSLTLSPSASSFDHAKHNMPSSRVTRGALAAAGDIASLSPRDRLIFAQAVYEYGTKSPAWHEIAKLLSNHPLISRPKNYFNAQSCATIYSYLMKEAGLERYVLSVNIIFDLTDFIESTDLSEGKKC